MNRFPFHTILLVVVLCGVKGPACLAQHANDSALASNPQGQFGFGASNAGFHVHFAVAASLHIGLNLNLDVGSYDSAGTTVTVTGYEAGPYLKYLIPGEFVEPYAYASFTLLREGSSGSLIYGSGRAVGAGKTNEYRLRVAFGGEHFFSQRLGIYSHVCLINAFVSEPASFHIGLVAAEAGGEFFF